MGGLKPIGSEKLQGMDKIRRIMEIATYNEVLPNSINENKSIEYSLPLSDGNTYSIVKEKNGYIIKLNLNESITDYIEPMQNRKYFSSYSQALKKLNLMAKEYNTMYGNKNGTNLFTEQKKKFILKTNKKKESESITPAPDAEPKPNVTPPTPDTGGGGTLPPPPDMDTGGGTLPPPPDMDSGGGTLPPPPDMGGGAGTLPPPPDMESGGETLPPPSDMEMGDDESMNQGDDEMDVPTDTDVDKSDKKEGSSFKIIQKLTGKLAQKIRKYNDNDEMDGNDVKYIINSILSALDVDVLDDDDLEEIISRLEGDYEEDESEDEDIEDEEMTDDTDTEETPKTEEPIDQNEPVSPEPPAGGEMSEYHGMEMKETMNLGDAFERKVLNKYAGHIYNGIKGNSEIGENDYGVHGARKNRHTYNHFEHGTFGESKVDKIISKYFNLSENEKKEQKIKEANKKNNLLETIENYKSKIYKLSENIIQERAALKFLEMNPNVKLLGITNKGNLIFKDSIYERKITPNGKIL